jgi:beta-galactosidase GanA
MRGVYATLMARDLGADVIRADEDVVDDDYSPYKVIFLPCPAWISPRTAEKLCKFVSDGGTLISEASLAQYDEEFLASTRVPGMGLDEVFGIKRAEGRILDVEQCTLIYGKITIPSRHYMEVLEPKGAKVIGTHEDGSPAITTNNFGRGQAIYIGSNPFMEFFNNPNEGLMDFLEDMLGGLNRPAYTDQWNTLARTMTSDDKKLVFVLSRHKEPVRTIITVVDERRSPVELIESEPPRTEIIGEDTRITVELGPNGVRCYLFE